MIERIRVHMVNKTLVLPRIDSNLVRFGSGKLFGIVTMCEGRSFVDSDCIGIWENRAYGASMSSIVNSVGYSVTGCVQCWCSGNKRNNARCFSECASRGRRRPCSDDCRIRYCRNWNSSLNNRVKCVGRSLSHVFSSVCMGAWTIRCLQFC